MKKKFAFTLWILSLLTALFGNFLYFLSGFRPKVFGIIATAAFIVMSIICAFCIDKEDYLYKAVFGYWALLIGAYAISIVISLINMFIEIELLSIAVLCLAVISPVYGLFAMYDPVAHISAFALSLLLCLICRKKVKDTENIEAE